MRSPLCAALEGMLRTPGRVPLEAAPRNKCRVPWQRREFPGLGGRKRPQPSSRLRKQNPIPVPREQNGRKATPRQRRWAPWEPQESLLFPGQRTVSRRGLHGAEGTGDRPSAAPSRALSAGRSRRAQRSGLHSRPPPLFPLRKPGGSYPPRSVAAAETPEAGLDAPGIHGALEIHRKAPPPRAPLGPPAFCPQSRWLPQTGGGGRRGEAGAPSPFWFLLSMQQLLPNKSRNGVVRPTPNPQPHASRSENWEGGRRASR